MKKDSFHYNKGNYRKMDNYYDCIKFIGIHNINNYQYKKLKLIIKILIIL